MEASEYDDEIHMGKQVLEHNKKAMSKLKELKYKGCLEWLQKAGQVVEILELTEPFNTTEKFYSVAAITYNNFGCYYQKK